MFDKAFQTAFICLRCRSRLPRPQPTRSLSDALRRSNSAARRQSTVAASVEEDEDDKYDHPQEDGELGISHSTSDSLRIAPKRRKGTANQYHGAYKKFHPERVADLGVSSLGKPAEVLVLPARNRYIPKVPAEDEGQDEPQLLEALQAETAPLDPEQVKHNIEQIKKPFGDGGQVLDEAGWKELRNSLVKGFTHVQLLDYIRHMESRMEGTSKQADESADTSPSTPLSSEISRLIRDKPDLKKEGRNKIKKQAAISIMKDIWGFSLRAGEEELEDVQSLILPMPSHHIGALKAQQSQWFKTLSESLKVRIDIFQEKSKLVIYGGTDAVEEARKALVSWRNRITSMTIKLGKRKHILPTMRQGQYEQMLLKEAGRNRPVYIEKKNLKKAAPSVRIFYHESVHREAEAARREILVAGRTTVPNSSISIWPQLKQQSAWLVPCTPWQALPWWERLSNWGRWSFMREADTNAQKAPPTHGVPTSTLTMEMYKWLCTSNLKPNLAPKFEPIIQQHSALFGQAIFRRDVKQQLQSVLRAQYAKPPNTGHFNIQQSDHSVYSSAPKIMTDIPLLAQSLASCKPWSLISKDSTNSTSQSTLAGQFMHLLLLLPVTAQPHTPPLQVYLKGDDPHLGLRQPLRIHSVSAILEERSHVLLLPDRTVDVQFQRQTLYQIYNAKRKRNPKHDQFNDQFLRYLNQAQGQDVPEFAPFVKLSLPAEFANLFKKLDSASAAAQKESEAPSGNPDHPSATPAEPLKSSRKVGATEYVLAVSETVDAVSFSHSVARGLCLDHVAFSAVDGTQSRQELRLAERPYPDVLAGSIQFTRLFDSAYAVASWLGDPKLLKEQA